MKNILNTISFFILLHITASAQVQWYVSTTGADAPGNGTLANPFKTVTYASNSLTPGDTLFVMGGTYTNATYGNGSYWKEEKTVRIGNINGTASQYIVIMPYQNQPVIFKGDAQFIFNVSNCSFLKVQGFEIYGETDNIPLSLALSYQFAFRRSTNTGSNTTFENRLPPGTSTYQSGLEDLSAYTIYRPFYFFTHGIVVQSSDHIEIRNNQVHHMPGEGIRFAGSDYIVCEGNEVNECSRRSSGGTHGISCYTMQSIDNNDATKLFFRKNLVHDNYCEMASWSELKTIFNPVVDEGKGLTIQRSYTANGWVHGRILFENNIAYRNGLSGIHVNNGDRVDIINNTVYQNNRYGQGNNIGISVDGSDFRIYNNIVESDLAWSGFTIAASATTTGLVVSNNLVNGGLDASVNAVDINTIFGTAQFVNGPAYNFHLQNVSSAINNALAVVSPVTDFYSNPRDAQPDRGAVEYFSALPLQLVEFTGTSQPQRNTLKWTVESNNNVSRFEVQYSGDRQNWNEAGVVNALYGNRNYSFIHQTTTNSPFYYRLKIYDGNGSFYYSGIIAISPVLSKLLTAYPNPVDNVVFVTGVSSFRDIQVFNAAGLNVTGSINIGINGNTAKLNAGSLASGNYFIVNGNQSLIIIKTK